MRIGGLASGIDTDSIIKQLMQVERKPLDRFFQRKQTIEWQRDAYRDINLKLRTLEESALSIRLRSSLNTRFVQSSNDQMFTATANSDVQNGTYKFKIDQIATKTRNIGTDKLTDVNSLTKFSAGVTLNAQVDALGSIEQYNHKEFTMKTFDANGVEKAVTVKIDTSKTLNDLFKQINESDVGVRAYYDSSFDRVVFERKETGEFGAGSNGLQITFEDGVNNPGGLEFLENILKIDTTREEAGQNAIVHFQNPVFGNEVITVNDSRTNRVVIGGMAFNLTEPTRVNQSDNTSPIEFKTITVMSNTDDAFEKIKTFVDTYNNTIAEIQALLSEPRYRDFPPLTDEQRKDLSEREAELWDEKAKSGMLRRDPMLSSILTQMRTDLYTPVQTSGQFNLISQIGISTTSNFRDGGRLEIDETKLRAALADDPDSVHQLFNNVADTSLTSVPLSERTAQQRQDIRNQTGLIGRLRGSINNTINEIVNRAGNQNRTNQQFTLGRELVNVDTQIDTFQRRLKQIEDRYWTQFSRMESAMNKANAQSDAMMNQLFGGMQ
ncbi:flagellar filament capping protein FliD [Halalkalibacter akibai]|uniref:Flagellar hook-associated protein 2 n=1 Tax=Halalkalibacter akibai (strain ATCC 43226 / DSM 21942 / CIP 109018 / JCM 9157 / 1139) TaxID=1236973 RepID=W4QLQ1_HALA3|nr:flagellar filament capping protein FliD [Halalkalibacter akibai]GAE33040.1 flagellar hook-associated protein FliD [Halalkalibacter akibai JCM 9157]